MVSSLVVSHPTTSYSLNSTATSSNDKVITQITPIQRKIEDIIKESGVLPKNLISIVGSYYSLPLFRDVLPRPVLREAGSMVNYLRGHIGHVDQSRHDLAVVLWQGIHVDGYSERAENSTDSSAKKRYEEIFREPNIFHRLTYMAYVRLQELTPELGVHEKSFYTERSNIERDLPSLSERLKEAFMIGLEELRASDINPINTVATITHFKQVIQKNPEPFRNPKFIKPFTVEEREMNAPKSPVNMFFKHLERFVF